MGFISYVILTIIVALTNHFKNWKTVDVKYDGFYVSFMASSIEDIMFFGLVGILVMLFGIREAKDDELDVRIANLFQFDDGNTAPQCIRKNIIDKAKRLAVYSSSNSVTLEINYYDEEKDAMWVTLIQETKLINMLHDLEYSFSRKSFIKPEESEKFPNGSDFGEIHSVHFSNNNGISKTIIANTKMKVGKSIEFHVDESLPRGGNGVTCSNYSYWHANEEEFVYETHHSVEKFSLKLINKINEVGNNDDLIVTKYNKKDGGWEDTFFEEKSNENIIIENQPLGLDEEETIKIKYNKS